MKPMTTAIDPEAFRSIVASAKKLAERRREVAAPLRAALERGAGDEIVVNLARKLVALKDEPLPTNSMHEEPVDEMRENPNEDFIWSQIEEQAGPEAVQAFARSIFSFAREVSRKRGERLEQLRDALARGDRDDIMRHSRYLVGLPEESKLNGE